MDPSNPVHRIAAVRAALPRDLKGYSEARLMTLAGDELQRLCEDRGLAKSGTKAEKVRRLLQWKKQNQSKGGKTIPSSTWMQQNFGAPPAAGFEASSGGFSGEGSPSEQQWSKAELQKQMAVDFAVAKNIWPFSSYGMPNETCILQEDFSFEEVRFDAYSEASEGRYEFHKAKEIQLAARALEDKNRLQNGPVEFFNQAYDLSFNDNNNSTGTGGNADAFAALW